jgi:Kef-type K+ transport system membrane component KefB/mannitol/fructose-specific phosphotransferase system IIA component (Ntr-type)
VELDILSLFSVLLAAWAGGAAAQRVGYPAVLGELVVGILLGPAWLGWLGGDGSSVALGALAQVGVLLMMLYIGMEIDPKELGKASWGGFLAAAGGFLTPFVMGWAAVRLFDGTHLAGIFVGIAVGVTSLATKSRILLDLKILDTRIAHVMLAGALVADTFSLLVFAGVLSFARTDTFEIAAAGGVALRAVVFFVGAALAGRYALPLLFRLTQRLGVSSRGVHFTLMVLVAFAFGEAAELAGLHAILGTFVAGLSLREGMLDPRAHRELHQLLGDVSVGFLAPIFFVMAGFDVSFEVFRTDLALFVTIMVVAFVGKIAGTALFYLPTGHGWREGVVLGAGMNGRGAVEIILAGIGLRMGLIDQDIFSILVFMAIITTATVPLFLKWGTDWLKRLGLLVRSTAKRSGVLVVGATPTSRMLAKVLGQAQTVWIVDSNPARVEEAKHDGLQAVVGSALDPEVLAEAQAAAAAAALVMTPNAEINALVARQLRDVFLVPELAVITQEAVREPDEDTLAHLDASALFGGPTSLAAWDYWWSQGGVRLERTRIQDGAAADLLGQLRREWPTLPVAVEREVDGLERVFAFTSTTVLQPGDTLVIARATVAAPPLEDRFDDLVDACTVLDIPEALGRGAFFDVAARALAADLPETADEIRAALQERERTSSTVLTQGLAVPHIAVQGERRFAMLVVRCLAGVSLADDTAPATAIFVLVSSPDERNAHLRALSAIAQIWQSDRFEERWGTATTSEDLRALLRAAPRQRTR